MILFLEDSEQCDSHMECRTKLYHCKKNMNMEETFSPIMARAWACFLLRAIFFIRLHIGNKEKRIKISKKKKRKMGRRWRKKEKNMNTSVKQIFSFVSTLLLYFLFLASIEPFFLFSPVIGNSFFHFYINLKYITLYYNSFLLWFLKISWVDHFILFSRLASAQRLPRQDLRN